MNTEPSQLNPNFPTQESIEDFARQFIDSLQFNGFNPQVSGAVLVHALAFIYRDYWKNDPATSPSMFVNDATIALSKTIFDMQSVEKN